MWYKIEKICLPCVHFSICLVTSLSRRSSFNVQTYKFSSSFFFILLLVTLQTYIWQKNWALLTDLLKVKNNMFLPDNGHTQKRRYSVNTHPWTSIGCFSWQLEYGYSPLQIYFKKGLLRYGVYKGSAQFLQIIFSLSHILVYL